MQKISTRWGGGFGVGSISLSASRSPFGHFRAGRPRSSPGLPTVQAAERCPLQAYPATGPARASTPIATNFLEDLDDLTFSKQRRRSELLLFVSTRPGRKGL